MSFGSTSGLTVPARAAALVMRIGQRSRLEFAQTYEAVKKNGGSVGRSA